MNRKPSSRSRSLRCPLGRVLVLFAATVPVQGCSLPFASLNGVTVGDHAAAGSELGGVTVIREGRPISTTLRMGIQQGDTIRTDAVTRAVIDIRSGYEVYLEENTELAVLNPSLLLRIGKAFVRGLERVKEALKVNTQYVVAAPTGTAFLIEVLPDSSVRYFVAEGTIRLEWRPQSDTASGVAPWPPVTYGEFEGGIIRRRQPPERTPRMSPQQIERELDWVRRVEELTTTTVPGLTGASLEEAQALLERARLRTGTVTERLQEGGRGGLVLSQAIREGDRVEPGSRVNLVVSVAGVRVPAVEGEPERLALARLEESGLRIRDRSEERVAGKPANTVVRIDPRRGTLVPAGSTVTLVIASPCVVPPLMRLTEPQARERVASAGLELARPEVLQYGNTVTQQTPDAGGSLTCGSQVRIVIGTNIGVDAR